MAEIRIALAGNPNSGKTTLFNVLTGSNQYVGNWPGVTVEKKEGKLKQNKDIILVDLPGIYSLSPYTLEEVVARNYLVGERPQAILNIVDGTNLERNLYLTTQLTELGIPVVVAINMADVIRRRGDRINFEALSRSLACPVFEISALKGTGVFEAAEAAIDLAKNGKSIPQYIFSGTVEHALAHIEEATVHDLPLEQQRWYSIKIFERDKKVFEQLQISSEVMKHIENDIQLVEKAMDDDAEAIITNERYIYIASILKGSYKKKNQGNLSTSDKIDRILTNRILALPIFILIMFLVYGLSIGTVGAFVTNFTNDVLVHEWAIPGTAALLESWGVADWLVNLVSQGIVGGVGAVLGFVPQMLILFFLLAILEDVGYMSRVAFIMDRLFRKFGLSGKSFIPMLISSGCGVPGVMASRTIEQERDRRMTIMTTCFIPCSAKMPIIGLIASALFGGSAWIATSAYFIGVAAVIISGIILKKTKMFSGDPAPFVMELPAYHAPIPRNVLRSTGDRGWDFVKRAGTVILAASILIWVLNSLSLDGGLHYIGESESTSILNLIGSLVAWIFAPLGFGTWQATVATALGLVAKEQVVGTIGTLISMQNAELIGELVENQDVARLAIIGKEFFGGSQVAAFSFMIFNLLCAPCFAAMGAIKREMNSAKWTFFALAYMTGFAYSISLIVYQIGLLASGAGFTVWTVVALVFLLALVYLLFRKNKNEHSRLNIRAVSLKN